MTSLAISPSRVAVAGATTGRVIVGGVFLFAGVMKALAPGEVLLGRTLLLAGVCRGGSLAAFAKVV